MLAAVARGLDSLLFPESCIVCRLPLEGPGWPACLSCAETFPAPAPPWCALCGIPLPSFRDAPEPAGSGNGNSCAQCRRTPPSFDGAVSPFLYSGPVRTMIHGFKYQGRIAWTGSLARRMAEKVREHLGERPADGCAAVPLHPVRRRERTFDQAERLAKGVAGELGLPYLPGLLVKTTATPPQVELDRTERFRNVRGAFQLGRSAPRIAGSRLLLVDDVLTTGATAGACAQVLKGAGAANVFVVTAARG